MVKLEIIKRLLYKIFRVLILKSTLKPKQVYLGFSRFFFLNSQKLYYKTEAFLKKNSKAFAPGGGSPEPKGYSEDRTFLPYIIYIYIVSLRKSCCSC